VRDRTLRVTRAMDSEKQEKVQQQKMKLLQHTAKSNKANKSTGKGKQASTSDATSKHAAGVQKQAFQNALQKSIAAPRKKVKHAKRKAQQAAATAAGTDLSKADKAASATKTSTSSNANQSYGGRNSQKRSFEGERAMPGQKSTSKKAKKTTFAEAQAKYAKSLVKTKPRSRSHKSKAAQPEATPSTQ
jgi:hypothetical protein